MIMDNTSMLRNVMTPGGMKMDYVSEENGMGKMILSSEKDSYNATLSWEDNITKCATISTFMVTAHYKRRSLAMDLIDAVEYTAEQLGFEKVIVYAPTNDPIKKWYEEMGYKETMPHKEKNDGVLMELYKKLIK